jgi:hypothetical protein
MEEPFVRGDMLKSITTLNKFKGIMNDLVRGYPAYLNWGIFESYFGENAGAVIKFLEEDGIIKTFPPKKEGQPVMYRVTSQGITFATAMAQLDYSEKMSKFTKIIIFISCVTLFITIQQLLIILLS